MKIENIVGDILYFFLKLCSYKWLLIVEDIVIE
ncbi:hypothetical protein EV214_11237 [Marinisporobacter balticus]|uniref:Uncharacterized protein n=1 Tax=Marinisporobacter balticus TaxID=2018667 RepID=A0A4V2SB87_9FIRM|nr:hypothetical protein EV214_11237 [Marinisporobacter balticus]